MDSGTEVAGQHDYVHAGWARLRGKRPGFRTQPRKPVADRMRDAGLAVGDTYVGRTIIGAHVHAAQLVLDVVCPDCGRQSKTRPNKRAHGCICKKGARLAEGRNPGLERRMAIVEELGRDPDPNARFEDSEIAQLAVALFPEGMTLEEISSLYGVTRERIRQIEARALRKLSEHMRKKDPKTYQAWREHMESKVRDSPHLWDTITERAEL